jgi:hypothetical protein
MGVSGGMELGSERLVNSKGSDIRRFVRIWNASERSGDGVYPVSSDILRGKRELIFCGILCLMVSLDCISEKNGEIQADKNQMLLLSQSL